MYDGYAVMALTNGRGFVLGGMVGVVCLGLSVRLAHASLQHKLTSRRKRSGSAKSKHKQDKEKQDDDVIEKEKSNEYENVRIGLNLKDNKYQQR